MSPEQLIEHFDLIAEAPGGIKRLRELILDLAVRGKLVPQVAGEERAKAAYLRALADRSWRVEEREAKAKAEPSIDALAGKAEPPPNWIECRLVEVAQLVNGRAYAQPELLAQGTPIIRIQNLNGGSNWYYSDLTLPTRQYCDAGDLLFAWSASFGPYFWHGGRAIYHYHIWKLVLSPAIDKRFMYFVLLHLTERVRQESHGLAMLHMTKAKMERWPILLPPLAEQRRIVAKVDELMGLLDRLEAARSAREASRVASRDACLLALREAEGPEAVAAAWARVSTQMEELFLGPEDLVPLRQAILQLAVRGRLVRQDAGDEPAERLLEKIRKAQQAKSGKAAPTAAHETPFTVPETWKWTRLLGLTSMITSGSRNWNQFYSMSGANFIRSQDIKHDRLEYDNRTFVAVPLDGEGTRTRVGVDDLLITITGANVGKCAHIIADPGESYVSQHVGLMRPVDGVIAKFLHLWLTGEFAGRGLLLRDSYGAKPGLNLDQLRRLPVPMPPLAEQHRIVAKVDELVHLLDRLEGSVKLGAERHTNLACTAARLSGALADAVPSEELPTDSRRQATGREFASQQGLDD